MNPDENKFEPISPKSLDESSSLKKTSKPIKNKETKDKAANGSYIEGEAKVLDLSTGNNKEKISLETKHNEKFALHISVF